MIRVKELYCKGCGLCIEFCPNKVLELSDKLNHKGVRIPVNANPEKCTKCRICELICPDSAIYIIDEGDESKGKRRDKKHARA